MNSVQTILDDQRALEYLREHDLEYGFDLLDAVLIQRGGTIDPADPSGPGRPAVLLVATIEGRKRVIKTSLRLLLTAAAALNAAAERDLGPGWRGP